MAVGSVPERVRWAVGTLDVRPADRLLEVGCGRGAAVSLVGDRLVDGTITAIDRSATMTRLAEQRNSALVAAGRAMIRTAELGSAEFGDELFDTVFTINVNLFWVRSPAREFDLIKRWLSPAGALHLCYEPPAAGQAVELAERLLAVLAEHGFTASVRTGTTATGASLLGVTARVS